jgi:hypothetical protein
MDKQFSKEDSKRLRRLEESLSLLKDGTQTYFPITKLISIKSLCNNQSALRPYCVYLSSQVLKHPGKLPIDIAKKKVKLIVAELANNPMETEESRELLYTIRNFQNQTKKIGWNTVRVINSNELLVLEHLLQALLSPMDVAPKYAYDATRAYVEMYNARYGTGLIVDSIPMFEKVIKFWRAHERSNIKMA